MKFPGGSRIHPAVKNPPANAGVARSNLGLGRSHGGGNGNLLQYSCLENPIDKEFLTDYSPWGHESTRLSD